MEAGGPILTKAAKLRRIEVVINPLAGSVGPTALDEVQALLSEFGLKAKVVAAQPAEIGKALDEALARKPDLLAVLAGDGTARAACELAGETGPLIAPLPGGTMNILPKALYGARDWRAALRDTLTDGVERVVSGGEIDGRRFYVAAMLGAPALFGQAREAAREHHLGLALLRARKAYSRAFSSRVRFSLDDGLEGKAQALTLLCPLVSRKLDEENALEAAAINLSGPTAALRIGARALGSEFFGDWRDDPAIDMGLCRKGRVWARNGIPVLLDGEPSRLGRDVQIRFRPKAFRALAPADEQPDKA